MSIPVKTEQYRESFLNVISKGSIPLPTKEGIIPFPLVDYQIPFCYKEEDLSTKENFQNFLQKDVPFLTMPTISMFGDFSELGFEKGAEVPFWVSMFPKRLNNGSTAPEEIRMSRVIATYDTAHGENQNTEYDVEGFDSIQEGMDSTALGVGIFTVTPDGDLVCVAAADIKYGAIKDTVYDEGGDINIDYTYVNSFLETYEETEFNGKKIILNFNNSDDLENFKSEQGILDQNIQNLYETEEKGFSVSYSPVVINPGQLPVHSLLLNRGKGISNNSYLEIGQLAGSENSNLVTVFLVSQLANLFRKIADEHKGFQAGFSISPHFLKSILSVKRINGALGKVIDRINLDEKIKAKVVGDLDFLTNQIFIYGWDEIPVCVIHRRNGTKSVMAGLYQGNTFEIPAYMSN